MAPGEFLREVTHHLRYTCLKEPPEADPVDLYRAMAHTVRDRLVERWLATQRKYVDGDVKRVNYLSAEFLTGRSLGLCLVNLGLFASAEKLATSMACDLDEILEAEGDPGLGNGGLGRLAACFMDSLATLDLPAAAFVNYLENHDQIAHSGAGLRGHMLSSPGCWRAMTACLLLSPGVPLLFQGQEFSSSKPFLFFADHAGDRTGEVGQLRRGVWVGPVVRVAALLCSGVG